MAANVDHSTLAQEFELHIPQAQVEAFYKALGWSAQRPSCPPIMATIFRKGEFTLFEKLGFQLSKVLHAEQDYIFHRDFEGGQTYRGVSKIDQLQTKVTRGVRITFIVFKTKIYETNRELIAECSATMVIKEPEAKA